MAHDWSGIGTVLAALDAGGVDILAVVMRVLHVASAVILVGGTFYLRTVLCPASGEGDSSACFGERRSVWARWVGIATLLLLVSGFYNFAMAAKQFQLPPTYHMLFGIKFLLALVVFFTAATIAGRSARAERARQRMRLWLNICWSAALAILVIAAMLRALPRIEKPANAERPVQTAHGQES